MKGIHDLGGKHGFGVVAVEQDEPVFHARWEGRVLGMVYQFIASGWANGDAFRFAIERMDPVRYLTVGYYGRWIDALERLLIERGVFAPDEVADWIAGRACAPSTRLEPPVRSTARGFERELTRPARFRVGDAVIARVAAPAGHTRLPDYVMGRPGIVQALRPAFVYPDSHALGRGEEPQHLYNVRFEAAALWGADAEPGVSVSLDLFEPYLTRV